MNKALAALLISLGVFVPALASAHSSYTSSRDRTPPSVTYIHIASNNADATRAKAGDTVTISFTTSEKVETPIVLVNSRPVLLRAANSAGNSWVASYQVGTKDPAGKTLYALAMEDMADNVYACTSIKLPFVAYCPTTDGSSVTIYKDTVPPPPPADTQAPAIEAHADVYATTTGTSAAVSYALPAATDNVDAAVSVSCTPASGSEFSLGSTTVVCTASDTAGNTATSSFAVGVAQEIIVVPPPEPAPYTMASQPDESYLCGQQSGTWRYCGADGFFSFTDVVGEGIKTIDLGQGSGMGTGTIQTVTIAKDPSAAIINSGHPWLITISCFADPSHTSSCSDWPSISDAANDTSDGTHWSADFSSLTRTFNQAEYYVMTIDDTAWETAAFGSESRQEPYWVVTGLR